MEKLKHTKTGVISFSITLILMVYFVIQIVIDIFNPIVLNGNMSFILMNLIQVSMLSGFVLGIVALFQKKIKKIVTND